MTGVQFTGMVEKSFRSSFEALLPILSTKTNTDPNMLEKERPQNNVLRGLG